MYKKVKLMLFMNDSGEIESLVYLFSFIYIKLFIDLCFLGDQTCLEWVNLFCGTY